MTTKEYLAKDKRRDELEIIINGKNEEVWKLQDELNQIDQEIEEYDKEQRMLDE